MGIKSADSNWFGTHKWFGCFLKDANALDKHTVWNYDVKQFPVDTDGHLMTTSSGPDLRVITSPYATSAAVVSAVSGAFKYYTHYDDGSNLDLSAMTTGEVLQYNLYVEASAITSSIASTEYYHFPYVPSGDWLHYAKGKTNYGLAGSSIFNSWDYAAIGDSPVLPLFSATSARPHVYMASAEVNGTRHGSNWKDNYPRNPDEQLNNPAHIECRCCEGWKVKIHNYRLNIVKYQNPTGVALKSNGYVSLKVASKGACLSDAVLCAMVEKRLVIPFGCNESVDTANESAKQTAAGCDVDVNGHGARLKVDSCDWGTIAMEIGGDCNPPPSGGGGGGGGYPGYGSSHPAPPVILCGKPLMSTSYTASLEAISNQDLIGPFKTIGELRKAMGLPSGPAWDAESHTDIFDRIRRDGNASLREVIESAVAGQVNAALANITIHQAYKCN